ncbi:TPA: MFS transporter [bacterium]|nr:MFS transporter [bacterium]
MRQKRIAILSWSLYDFANSIFSVNILSLYFPLWIVVTQSGKDFLYGFVVSASLLTVALGGPLAGAISDRKGKRQPFLIFFTLTAIFFTFFLNKGGLYGGLFLFFLANFSYQISGIFYNTLLKEVAKTENVGSISGYGVAFGYLGAISSLLIVRPLVEKGGYEASFIPTALLYLIFALPCFFFVKESPRLKREESFSIIEVQKKIFETLKKLKESRGFISFFITYFLATNAISAVTAFMAIYVKKVVGLMDEEMNTLFILSTIFAAIGALISGKLGDKIGHKQTIGFILIIWCLVIILALFATSRSVYLLLGPLVGLCLGVWGVARALGLIIAPPEKIGEFFGLYAFAGKSAEVLGPLVWGLIAFLLQDFGILKYRLALLGVLLFFIGSLIALRWIPDTKAQNKDKRE